MEFDINKLITKDKKTIEDGGHTKITRGRPKSTKPKRDQRIAVYLTKDEMSRLENLADEDDITVSTMIRKLVLKGL
jgi:predicted transglutaminase-like cysteine proteinase